MYNYMHICVNMQFIPLKSCTCVKFEILYDLYGFYLQVIIAK
jgi:hypothetical protein